MEAREKRRKEDDIFRFPYYFLERERINQLTSVLTKAEKIEKRCLSMIMFII
jgi:hypothetical protein